MAAKKVRVFDGFFVPTGDVPAAFKDINVLQIADPGQAKTPPYGYLEFKSAHTPKYQLLKPTLDGQNLSFKTRAVLANSYEFRGTLPKTDYESVDELNHAAVVLSGTLKKIQAGKIMVEGKVAFGWFAGD